MCVVVLGAGKLYPEYYLYLKQGDRFLLAGRKRPNNKVCSFNLDDHIRYAVGDSRWKHAACSWGFV